MTKKLKATFKANADKRTIAADIAAKHGDNKRLPLVAFEAVILRAGASDAQLIEAVQQVNADQDAVRQRALAAHVYVQSYMADVAHGKLAQCLTADGSAIVPPLTDEKRAYYASLLKGASPEAKTLGASQVRRTVEQEKFYATARKWWQRLLMKAGVKTISRQGGARVRKGKSKKAKGANIQTVTPAAVALLPLVPDGSKAAQWFQMEAKHMVQFATKNRKHCEPFRALAVKFLEDVSKLANA